MEFKMEYLSSDFIVYVKRHWIEHGKLSKQIEENDKAKLSISLDNLLNYHINNNYRTEDLENNLNSIIHKCTQLLNKASTTEQNMLLLEAMETEYQLFMESYGVDLDDRTYDEEFYGFIHGM